MYEEDGLSDTRDMQQGPTVPLLESLGREKELRSATRRRIWRYADDATSDGRMWGAGGLGGWGVFGLEM